VVTIDLDKAAFALRKDAAAIELDRMKDGQMSNYKRILVPLDGSPRAEKVLPLAKAEAAHHQAVLVIIRVIPPLDPGLMLIPATVKNVKDQLAHIASDYLDELVLKIADPAIEIQTEVLIGPTTDNIINYAKENKCDLIIIGAQGSTGSKNWRIGSITNKILRAKSPPPILVVNNRK
jgi:nucleotide-binding universal stress UspA family protein